MQTLRTDQKKNGGGSTLAKQGGLRATGGTAGTAAAGPGATPWRRVAMGVFFSVIWSSAFVAGKVAVAELGPFVSLFYRFAGTVLVLLLLCGKSLWGPQGGQALAAGMLMGLLNNVLYLGLSFSALRLVSASWVVVIVSCSPFITLFLGMARGLETFSLRKLLGFAISLGGVVVMVGVVRPESAALTGVLLAAGATLAFAAGAVLFRGKYGDLPLLPVNFWMSVCAMACFAPAAWRSGATPLDASLPALVALAWLAVVSLAGMALWLLLIRTQGASNAAAYNMLNPLSGLALSAVVLGTSIGVNDVLGAAGIVAGLAVAMGWRVSKRRFFYFRDLLVFSQAARMLKLNRFFKR